jgi:beta-phosphoglucomutase-like phosphatase (HAD superfamily)
MTTSGKALLFDIDGTLTDTDALHLEAFNEVLGPHGHVFDHARFTAELQGFSNASISERFLAGEPPERQAAIMGEKEQAFRKLVAGRIQPLPGLMALLARADRANVPMVAVTNAPRLNAEMLLSGLGIADAKGVGRFRGFPLRCAVCVLRRHCDDRNTDEPEP